jgi:SAM-dependent methyltransferase
MSDGPDCCCFDDWADSYARRARRRRLGGPSSDLIRGLEHAGLQDRTILDVGCGAGGLIFDALERGARAATGVDLSSASIDRARRISSERGLGDRATFDVGDGAVASLERHDVVVLDKVFCCFADADGLLGNSLSAADTVYAFSVPPSAGIRGAVRRALAAVENRWYGFRPRRYGGFRTHVHDVGTLDARVRAAGFERVYSRRRFAWDVAVYAR